MLGIVSYRRQPIGDSLMADKKCEKCGGVLDTGIVVGHGYQLVYRSDNVQFHISHLFEVDPLVQTYACLDCGHLTSYVDPGQLRQKINCK